MIITVIDDEAMALKATVRAVREAIPGAEIHSFSKCSALLEFSAQRRIDIAFLDINMRGYTGIEIAQKLKEFSPKVNIIFVTGYDEYKSAAMDLHASGYLMKPIVADDIRNEMRFLRFSVSEKKAVQIRCFGNFAVEANGLPIRFAYKKTEELFAYLIDRKGATVTYRELSAVLWEDDTHINYLKKLRNDLKNVLKEHGAADVIIFGRGVLAVDRSKVDCDYYDFLDKKDDASHTFLGEYMTQYSWAEVTLGELLMK